MSAPRHPVPLPVRPGEELRGWAGEVSRLLRDRRASGVEVDDALREAVRRMDGWNGRPEELLGSAEEYAAAAPLTQRSPTRAGRLDWLVVVGLVFVVLGRNDLKVPPADFTWTTPRVAALLGVLLAVGTMSRRSASVAEVAGIGLALSGLVCGVVNLLGDPWARTPLAPTVLPVVIPATVLLVGAAARTVRDTARHPLAQEGAIRRVLWSEGFPLAVIFFFLTDLLGA